MTISLIVLQGPSASGKSTIQAMLGIPKAVTWTSRPPRTGETDGVDYVFRTRDEMQRLYGEGQMIEMTEYHRHLYGTPVKLVEDIVRGGGVRSIVLDAAGAARMKALFDEHVLLIGVRAEREQCERRLAARGHDPAEIRKRLGSYDDEIAALSHCELVLNNTDGNRAKIDAAVSFLKEGLLRNNGG